MRIVDLLNENVVRTNLAGNTKNEIINAIIDVAASQERVIDKERVRMMQQTVEDGGGDDLVVEDFSPLFERLVGSNNR